MNNIICLAILIMPWVFLPDVSFFDQMRTPKAVFFDFVCMAIIASAFIQGTKFAYKNKWFGAMFLVIMFGFFFNWYLPYMVVLDGKRALNLWNIVPSIHAVFGMIACYMAMSSLERASYIRIAKAICLSAFLVSCFGILQAVGFDPMVNITTYKIFEANHVAAILDHPNTLGNFLALSIPFYLFFESSVFVIGAGVCCLCLYFTHSSTSIMAFFLSSISYFVVKYVLARRDLKCLMLTGATFVLMTFVVTAVPSFNKISVGLTGRLATWKYAIERIKDNPVFGQGLGRFGTFGFSQSGMKWEFIHNDYLEMGVSIGFLGLFIFAVLIFTTFKNFNLSKENTIGFSYIASLIAFLVVMGGSFPMEFAPCALLGMIAFCGSEKL